MTPRFLGHLPDRAKRADEAPDLAFSWRLRHGIIGPELVHDLQHLVVDVLDQGSLGSCTANAAAQALRMCKVRQKVEPILDSRLFLYYGARALENSTLEDAGAQIRDIFRAARKQGFPPESAWPYDISKFAKMPPWSAQRAAVDQVTAGAVKYERIFEIKEQRYAAMRSAISQGHPIEFGCLVDERFCDGRFDAKKPIAGPDLRKIQGGHALLFVGYDGENFMVLNSWSDAWGDRGYCWFAPSYVDQCMDLWVVQHAAVEGEK